MSSYRVARRSFLRGCSAVALLGPLLRNIEARAQGMAAPLRLLIIHHPLGTAPGGGNWVPPSGSTTLPLESAPFAPLQSKMVMIDGLNIVTASKQSGSDGGQNTHEGGIVALMTGVPTLGKIGQQDHAAGGPSIDQILLGKAPGLGGPDQTVKTPFGSLALAADIRSDRDEVAPRVLSYKAPTNNSDISLARQPIYPETQPLNVFNRIFGGSVDMSGTSGATLLAQKRSVLDFMRGDLARLQSIVPASEKDRLAAHAQAIEQLEQSLQAMYGGGGGMSSVCMKPAAPPNYSTVGEAGMGKLGGISGSASNLSGVDYYPATANCTASATTSCHPHQDLATNQLRIIKAAFACDLVRVATFMYSAGTNWVVFPTTFQGVKIPSSQFVLGDATPHHPPSHSSDSGTVAWLSQINQFYSTVTSPILQEFAQTTDVDGNNLLDNTVVVYVTEVARAWDHNQQNTPVLVFGGKNTGVKGGTILRVSGGPLGRQSGGTGNRPMNDLWLSVMAKFGVNMTSLGSNSQYTGPLAGIFA